jgi:hypothetical protein
MQYKMLFPSGRWPIMTRAAERKEHRFSMRLPIADLELVCPAEPAAKPKAALRRKAAVEAAPQSRI